MAARAAEEAADTMPPTRLEVTGTAQREAWYARRIPDPEELRPGLWSVPVPYAGNPVRYTLSYLFVGRDSVLIVDPGWDSDDGYQALSKAIANAGCELPDVSRVIVTHGHPDHHGMTHRLQSERPGLSVALHKAERAIFDLSGLTASSLSRRDRQSLERAGVPDDAAELIKVPAQNRRVSGGMKEPDRYLEDWEIIDAAPWHLRTIPTPGHTPGHICLLDEEHNLLLTGDHILPRITPNVGIQLYSSQDPLSDYIASLDRLDGIDVEVLPAHEWRFRRLNLRLQELRAHHRHRCEEVIDAVSSQPGATCWQIAQRLTWSRGWSSLTGISLRAALGETAAHLRYLVNLGRLAEEAGPSANLYAPC